MYGLKVCFRLIKKVDLFKNKMNYFFNSPKLSRYADITYLSPLKRITSDSRVLDECYATILSRMSMAH